MHLVLEVTDSTLFSDSRAKDALEDQLKLEFERVPTYNLEKFKPRDLFRPSFDPSKSEVTVGFTYDHHAYAIYDSGLEKLNIPKVKGIQLGKFFRTLVDASKDDYRALIGLTEAKVVLKDATPSKLRRPSDSLEKMDLVNQETIIESN